MEAVSYTAASASAHRAHRSETMGQKLDGNLNIMVCPLPVIKNPLVTAQKVREACETGTGLLSSGWARTDLETSVFLFSCGSTANSLEINGNISIVINGFWIKSQLLL